MAAATAAEIGGVLHRTLGEIPIGDFHPQPGHANEGWERRAVITAMLPFRSR